MLSIYHRTIRQRKLQELKKATTGSWIEVINPKEEEVEYLKNKGVDTAFIEDALDPDELPRIEKEKGIIYVMLNLPYLGKEKVFNIPFLVVITESNFITICLKEIAWLKQFFKQKDIYITQKTKNLIRICLQATELYTREIRKINKEINTKKISLSRLDNKEIIGLVELEETLNNFITALVYLIGIFGKILAGKLVKVFDADQELLQDLIIDSKQSLDMCKTSIKKIVNIREAHSTILGNSLNKVMKLVASLTLIMGVSNIIAGFYGMNVRLPIQLHPLAFLYIVGLSLIISLVLISIFYFRKWL